MENKTVVIETYMHDGIDRVHIWSTVEEAFNSGRFDYLETQCEFDEDMDLDMIENSSSVEELITNVGYPFEVFSGDLNELLESPYVKLF